MNSGQSTAKSSSSGQENGAALLESERPHKKARFPWQIKGKHHLKNQTNELTESSLPTSEVSETVTAPSELKLPSRIVPFPKMTSGSDGTKAKPNIDFLNSTLGKSLVGGPTDILSPLPLETVISLAETMLLNSEVEGKKKPPIQNLPGPSNPYIHPFREARRKRREEERCISRWQAAQTVKGCFDNTINRVLESWMNASIPGEERFMALDFARIINDLPPNDDNVENEGILMAINAHGLQNMRAAPTMSSVPAMPPTGPFDDYILSSDIPISEHSDSSICSEDFEIPIERDNSPWPTDDRIGHPSADESVNYEPWRPIHENRNADPPEPYEFPNPGEDYNEYDFMNTAVIQAIKSKGLMTAGTDFG